MEPRMDYAKASPGAYRAMAGLEGFVRQSGIEHGLLHLVKMRASQMNGCAYCIDMHSKDARAAGETEQRLYALDAWRETPFYTPRERAALAWTEALTNVQDGHVPDAVFHEARAQFSEAELMNLTMAVVAINGWNRLAIAFRAVPGSYQPPAAKHAAAPAQDDGIPVAELAPPPSDTPVEAEWAPVTEEAAAEETKAP